jgi:hypothetical protein
VRSDDPPFVSSDGPLAYLITFPTYGTWLHGDERGSVDRDHNLPGTPVGDSGLRLTSGVAGRAAVESHGA